MIEGLRYAKLDYYYSFLSREIHVPFFGTFELTPRCNMNCKMCYIRMDSHEMSKIGRELDIEEWKKIAKAAVDKGMTHLLLTGGEPLLYKNFKELYLELRKMGLFISINTNGTLINEEWVEFFANNLPAQINITVYGGSNETYNKLCGNPKGFDQMKYAVEQLKKNKIRILLNCVITKQNIQDMDLIFKFGRDHESEINATAYCFPPVRKEGVIDPELNRFSPKDAAIARTRLNWTSINDREMFYDRAVKLMNCPETVKNLEESCVDAVGEKILCAAGRSNFWITWDGRMLPCGMIPDFSVSLKEKSFDDAWKEIVEYTSNIRLAPECKKCNKKSVCAPCAAKLKAETGTYCEKSDYMCEMADEYIKLMGKAKEYLENNKIEK